MNLSLTAQLPGRHSTPARIYRADLDAEWPGGAGLPAGEMERAVQILHPPARRRWVASRWALRSALGRELGEEPRAVELRVGPRGKPELAGDGDLRFNLSHSAGVVLIAIARGHEVGVDVEWIDPERDLLALARRGLGPAEASAVRNAPPAERPRVLYEAWARREAVAKCLGVGLGAPLPDAPVTVSTIDAGPGFAAALAYGRGRPPAMSTKAKRPERTSSASGSARSSASRESPQQVLTFPLCPTNVPSRG